jgi:hypothetical protein
MRGVITSHGGLRGCTPFPVPVIAVHCAVLVVGVARTRQAVTTAGLPFNPLIWTESLRNRKPKMLGADCNVDCDDGGGGPGDECTCS